MLKLNKNYYISIGYDRKLVGRFVNFRDALYSLPEVVPCFGPTLRGGRVYYIDDEYLDPFNRNEFVEVFESIEEFNKYNKNEEIIL